METENNHITNRWMVGSIAKEKTACLYSILDAYPVLYGFRCKKGLAIIYLRWISVSPVKFNLNKRKYLTLLISKMCPLKSEPQLFENSVERSGERAGHS